MFLPRGLVSAGRPRAWMRRVWTVFQGVDTWARSSGGTVGVWDSGSQGATFGFDMLSEQCSSWWPSLPHL